MNLIDESLEAKQNKGNSKKTARIILIFITILIIGIVAILFTIMYMKNNTLKLYVNGSINTKVQEMMITESDGKIYFPIRDIAPFLGYSSYSGEYTDKSEDASKCYIQCENEVANFTLNSNKIYTLETTKNNANYEYFYAEKPVKAINGKLYATTDALEKAFNISFTYNEDTKRIYIYTMPFLVETYSTRILDYGYEKISEEFVNQKALLNNMIVVTKDQNKVYAVIDLKGNDIIESKYDDIKYIPSTGDFLVKSNNKVGIISAAKKTKIQILYDSLDLIDNDSLLFLAKKDDKYGVIDSNGSIKIYIEYDEIGIDNTKFEQNNIKNKYLLDNGMIPARKNKVWGAFDKNGKQVVEFIYDSFGYIASNNKDAINLLMIPDYNVMVACRDKKYALISPTGEDLFYPALVDDIYMTISGGKKHYYMNYNNQTGNVEEILDQVGVKNNTTNSKNKTTNNNSKTEENTIDEEKNKNKNNTKNEKEDESESTETTETETEETIQEESSEDEE